MTLGASPRRRRHSYGAAAVGLIVALALLGLVSAGLDPSGGICLVRAALGSGDAVTCGGSDINDQVPMDLSDWTFPQSNVFASREGQLCNDTGAAAVAWRLGSQGDDYTITVQATLLDGQGYGVVFRRTGTGPLTGYDAEYVTGGDGGTFVIRKWVDGYAIDPPLATAPAPAWFTWFDTPHAVSISAQGDRFTVTIGQLIVLSATDPSFQTGLVGVRTLEASDACFSAISVTHG